MIEQETELAAHNPASVRAVLAPDLLRAAPFSSRMEQFNPIAINQSNQRRLGQKAPYPMTMRFEQPKQSHSLWQVGKQIAIVTYQPAAEGSVSHAFKRKQQGQCYHFT